MYRPLFFLLAFALYATGIWAVAETDWSPGPVATTVAARAAAPVAPVAAPRPAPSPAPTLADTVRPAVWTPSNLRDYLVAELNRTNPSVALGDLDRITLKSPYVAGFCHPIAHDLGHAALAKYDGDFAKAVSYRNDVCGSGYLHGVVEDKLAESPDPETEVTTLCSPDQTASCVHGIGHGAMFVADLDVPKAEQLCDRFPRTYELVACSEGVFMQLFEPDVTDPRAMAQLRPAHFAGDPFYPCPAQPAVFQSACYYYAPSYFLQQHDYAAHPGAFVQALDWCRQAPSAGQASCTMGAGSRIMKYNIARPVWTAAQCEQAQPWQRPICMAGVVSYWDVNYHDDSAASKLCPQLSGEARDECRAAAGSGSSGSED